MTARTRPSFMALGGLAALAVLALVAWLVSADEHADERADERAGFGEATPAADAPRDILDASDGASRSAEPLLSRPAPSASDVTPSPAVEPPANARRELDDPSFVVLPLRVTDARSGDPVTDAGVFLWDDEGAYFADSDGGRIAARTDAEGRCRVSIPRARSVLRVAHPVAGGSGWIPAGELVEEWRFNSGGDELAIVLRSGWIGWGMVSESDGRPAAGCEIFVDAHGWGFRPHFEGPVVSDPDGAFEFETDVEIASDLRARRGDQLSNADTCLCADSQDADAWVLPAMLVMPGRFEIAGLVLAPDGRPVAGLTVAAKSDPDLPIDDPIVVEAATTDELGRFVLEPTRPATYLVLAEPHEPTWMPAAPVAVDLTTDVARASVVLEYVEQSTLVGTVVGDEPSFDATRVSLVAEPSGGLGSERRALVAPTVFTTPGARGTFTLKGINPRASYDVSVRMGGDTTLLFVPDVPGDSQPLALVVPAAPSLPRTLRGRVTRLCEPGVPIVGATVVLMGYAHRPTAFGGSSWRMAPSQSRPVTTDAAGGFEIEMSSLSRGPHVSARLALVIEASGLQLTTLGPIDRDTVGAEPLDVTVAPLASLEVAVLDEDGQPVAAVVRALAADGVTLPSVETVGGVARMTGLAATPIAVRVDPVDRPARVETVAVSPCAMSRVRVVVGERVEPSPTTFLVRGPRGEIPAGATLQLLGEEDILPAIPLDADGRARTTCLPGNYDAVVVTGPGKMSLVAIFVPPEGGLVEVVLDR